MRGRSSRASSTRSDPRRSTAIEIGCQDARSAATSALNAAIFSNDYADIQLPTTVCAWAPPGQQTPCASQNNVGDADVWGIEFEAEWHLDRRAHARRVVTARSTSSTRRIDPGATAVTLGMITPYTPETKASIGLQYGFALGGGGTFTPRLDASYTDDDLCERRQRADELHRRTTTVVNARLTWRSADDGGKSRSRARTSRTSTTT